MKTSLRVPIEAVGLPCRKHKERQAHHALSLPSVVLRKFLRFYRRLLCSIALNHPVALHRLAAVSAKTPYRFRSRGTRDPTDAATVAVPRL